MFVGCSQYNFYHRKWKLGLLLTVINPSIENIILHIVLICLPMFGSTIHLPTFPNFSLLPSCLFVCWLLLSYASGKQQNCACVAASHTYRQFKRLWDNHEKAEALAAANGTTSATVAFSQGHARPCPQHVLLRPDILDCSTSSSNG